MAEGLRIARERLAIEEADRAEVLRYLGYHGQGFAEGLDGRVDAMVARCREVGVPRMGLASYDVREARDESVELEGCTLRLVGRDVSAHLAGARTVVLMAVTLGADVDRELRRLSHVDALDQVVFDSVATTFVERAADAAEARIRSWAATQGLFTSWRYSPGYGDLPLSVQADLLAALDATRQLGITLTPSDLMIPTKSVTAVVGVHPTPQPGLASSCSICMLADFCTIKQTGRTCRG